MPEPSPTQPAPPDPRVVLAAERTLLAWLRTGLALMGFGFVVARFGWFLRELTGRPERPVARSAGTAASLWIGTALVVMGVWVLLGATARYRSYIRALDRGDAKLPGPGLGLAVGIVLGAVGVAMTAYLVVLGLR